MTVPDFTGAPCADLSLTTLFDSTHAADHEQAAALCAGCPRRIACHLHAATVATEHGLIGTWAGTLYGYKIPKCGTEHGYQYHRRQLNERPCDPCKQARSVADRNRRLSKKAATA